MAQVRLGSGLGRIRVPKPRKSSAVASVCFLLGWVCVPVLCPILLSREYYSTAVVVIYTCMVYAYECVDVRAQVRTMVE